ncbi:zinc finger protein Helios isoform X2 [Hippoglossus stenolepis]|uniref:zinc finger protein Helios isoform X2 n=1 Tax=Hippoglossus stenolepis TaxID=195615 RepID=UPI00159C32E8|nr:zinc finger protein Helios isoform X2 [Hippoglossus stenolepis]
MEAPDGHCASNGQCSPGKENARVLVDMSTPNGETDHQGPNSPSELNIKQEEDTAEETDDRSPALEEISQTGDEVVVLEESMAGSPSNAQDGLSELNTTADSGSRQPNVGKPHKCNYCGRSYKQRTSLEEHKERCHSYLQGIGLDPTAHTGPYTGEGPKEPRAMAEANAMATFDRPPVIERLHSNVGKRKSTTPQKFVGEKMVRYSYPDIGYEMGIKYEKQAELIPAHMMDQAISNAITYLGSDSLRPMLHHTGPPLSMADVVPMVNPLYHHVLPMGQRTEHPGNCDSMPPHRPQSHNFPGHPTSNGPTALTRQDKPPRSGHEESPSNSGADSADSARSSPQERQAYHGVNPPPGLRSRVSPAVICSGERMTEPSQRGGMGTGLMRVAAERPVSQRGVRVFAREGQELRAFQCRHCQVLFLDHVMYTIHMGCHGYRDPLECNICGHRSKDRYEFSSHIVRGEHTFQ